MGPLKISTKWKRHSNVYSNILETGRMYDHILGDLREIRALGSVKSLTKSAQGSWDSIISETIYIRTVKLTTESF